MIVTSIKLYSAGIERASFGLNRTDPFQNYLLTSAVGLDVSDISPQFYGLQITSSGKPKSYFNMNLKEREIVLRVRLNPSYTTQQSFSSLRDNLYKTISSSNESEVELRFFNGVNPVCSIKGYVKKLENQLFNLNPEMQITIRCEDPIFRSVDRIEYPLTTFNFGFPVITDDVSTAPHGFKASILVTANSNGFFLNKPPNSDWRFEINYDFIAGDIIYISSEEDDKYVYRTRQLGNGGFTSLPFNLTDRLSVDSTWPLIFPGTNNFRALGSFTWQSFSFNHAFWGV